MSIVGLNDGFGDIERVVARILSATPRLKKNIKRITQRLFCLLHRKPYHFKSAFPIKPICDAQNSFFGYYDKCPVSPDGTHILYQTSDSPSHLLPDPHSPIEVVCQNLKTGEVIFRISTEAYNWQQGAKLQWVSPDRFMFNAYDSQTDRYVAHMYDLLMGRLVRTLPMPVYDCFCEQYALTLNYDRLAHLAPDYGYFCRQNKQCNIDSLTNDGVWCMDIVTGKSRLILSLEALVQLGPLHSMRGAQHLVNHIMISPDGKRFIVIHRWYKSNRRFDRMVMAGIDGSSPMIIADEGMVSHCFWRDSAQILGYLRHSGVDGYFLFNADSGDFRKVGSGVIDGFGDGHPSVQDSKVLFDSYPNKARMKKLLLYDLDHDLVKELGEFYEGFKFVAETRCDLHPRFSPDGNSVFFDSVHTGQRQLYRMDLLVILFALPALVDLYVFFGYEYLLILRDAFVLA